VWADLNRNLCPSGTPTQPAQRSGLPLCGSATKCPAVSGAWRSRARNAGLTQGAVQACPSESSKLTAHAHASAGPWVTSWRKWTRTAASLSRC
jgi:hypothetical protein